MKPWSRLLFSLSSLAILTTIGITLHELDMPVARFVRSFDIAELNRLGDMLAILGQGAVVAGVFCLIGLLGLRLDLDRLKGMGVRAVLTTPVGMILTPRPNQLGAMSFRGLVAMAGVGAVSQLFKHLIGRPRPRFAHADEFSLGPTLDSGLDSFPSGHAINAFGAATVLAWFLPRLRAPVFLLAGLVGLSRVLRGSHFPTDVFAGAVLGVLIGSLAAAGWKRWWEDALPALIRIGVPIAVSIFLVVWIILHPMPSWSDEVWHVCAGATLILAGMLALERGTVRDRAQETRGGHLRRAGVLAMMVGVAVATGPWWISGVLLVALIPTGLAGAPGAFPSAQDHGGGRGRWVLQGWARQAVVIGAVLLAIAAIRSMKGVLPLG